MSEEEARRAGVHERVEAGELAQGAAEIPGPELAATEGVGA